MVSSMFTDSDSGRDKEGEAQGISSHYAQKSLMTGTFILHLPWLNPVLEMCRDCMCARGPRPAEQLPWALHAAGNSSTRYCIPNNSVGW